MRCSIFRFRFRVSSLASSGTRTHMQTITQWTWSIPEYGLYDSIHNLSNTNAPIHTITKTHNFYWYTLNSSVHICINCTNVIALRVSRTHTRAWPLHVWTRSTDTGTEWKGKILTRPKRHTERNTMWTSRAHKQRNRVSRTRVRMYLRRSSGPLDTNTHTCGRRWHLAFSALLLLLLRSSCQNAPLENNMVRRRLVADAATFC